VEPEEPAIGAMEAEAEAEDMPMMQWGIQALWMEAACF
jgi:hypothetical protein